MAQKFQKLTVKPKAVSLSKNQWVVIPDPFGKHETRVAKIRSFQGNIVEVGVCYTHFSPEVAGKAAKPATSPNGKPCRILNASHFVLVSEVRPMR